jgi:lipoprotein-anchoring transpeptidase ErfK/SrfK
MHVPPRRSAARALGLATAMLALAVLAGCAQGASAAWHGPGDAGVPSGAAGGETAKKFPGEFKITPAADTTGVSVLDSATVTAQDATLDSVTVTNADGRAVDGDFDADHKSWHTTAQFGYGKQYTVTAKGTNSGNQPIEQTSTFTTLKPKNLTMPYLQANASHLLQNGATYGVGQAITVHWDEPITDKAAAQKALQVTTNPHVDGDWYWADKQDVMWRPQQYWASGTQVSVKATVYGQDLGGGLYGQSDVSASFKIGQSRIAIADSASHTMQVYIDGKLVRTIPISMGMGGTTTGANGQTIDFWTRSGVHTVIGKAPVTHMSSASYGLTDKNSPFYYDEDIKQTVQISFEGEYMHLRTWDLTKLGRANTSHGCINIGPADADWVYNTFDIGDVVEVKNTPKQLTISESPGGWNVPWSQWLKGGAQ